MIHHRTTAEVRKFDLFKLIVALVLLVLLALFLILRPFQSGSVAGPTASLPAIDANLSTEAGPESNAAAEVEAAAPSIEIDPPTLTAPASGETLTGETIALAGTAEPGSTVEIVIDGRVVGVAPVGNDGTWAFSASVTEPGPHEIGLNTLDPEGQCCRRRPANFAFRGCTTR